MSSVKQCSKCGCKNNLEYTVCVACGYNITTAKPTIKTKKKNMKKNMVDINVIQLDTTIYQDYMTRLYNTHLKDDLIDEEILTLYSDVCDINTKILLVLSTLYFEHDICCRVNNFSFDKKFIFIDVDFELLGMSDEMLEKNESEEINIIRAIISKINTTHIISHICGRSIDGVIAQIEDDIETRYSVDERFTTITMKKHNITRDILAYGAIMYRKYILLYSDKETEIRGC